MHTLSLAITVDRPFLPEAAADTTTGLDKSHTYFQQQ